MDSQPAVVTTDNGHHFRIGVRELAEFSCRQGDLERGPAGPTAVQGRLAHQRLQEEQPGLVGEVALKRTITIDGMQVTLAGRMDLVNEAAPRLIEIKSTLVPHSRLTDSRLALDRAQLCLYAWLWLDKSSERFPDLELCYVNLRDNSIESVVVQSDSKAVSVLALQALKVRVAFEKSLRRRRGMLADSARQLDFPHGGLRVSQRTLAVATYRSLRDGKPLVVEAPTGSGKSLGTLFPAVKSLGESHVSRIIWLTAKRSGRDAACQALTDLAAQGLQVDALVLRARSASCACEHGSHKRQEHPITLPQDDLLSNHMLDGKPQEVCVWTLDYYARLRELRQALFDGEARLLDSEQIDRLAREHRLCPHALTQDLMPWIPIVICDYNHVFDPIAAHPVLTDPTEARAVLVDEAHNLPSRARAMRSVSLTRSDFRTAARETRRDWPALSRAFDSLARSLSKSLLDVDGHDLATLDSVPVRVLRSAQRLIDVLENPPHDQPADASPYAALSNAQMLLVLDVHRLMLIDSQWTHAQRCLVKTAGAGRQQDVQLRILCLDASSATGKELTAAHASVLMSATLSPLTHFRDAFGLPEAASCLRVASPFQQSQCLCQLIDWIPVTWAERRSSLPALVALIKAIVSVRSGHYLVFLPSYSYLTVVYEAFSAANPDRECWRQPQQADPAVLAQRLNRLEQDGQSVGFAIAGGSLGEGIDYRGERLIGAIVIGVGLAAPGIEVDLEVAHHREQGRSGYDVACRYPGFVRVLQSAGRVVRTEQDRGVVVLVDSRLNDGFYRALLPDSWTITSPININSASRDLKAFWEPTNRIEQQAQLIGPVRALDCSNAGSDVSEDDKKNAHPVV